MNKLIKNLTVAAAISIAIIGVYTPATASANGGSWQRDSVGWWYKNSNGSYPKNDWQRIDGKWYYFDGRGYITHSKWERIKDYWYYFNTSGHMTENAWEMIGDKWYYFDNKGHMLSNQWVGDYYVGRDGYMLKNTITPDNYVVGSDGKWDKRFSRELAEKAKNRNLYRSDISKYAEAYNITFGNRGEYNNALQLIEIIYPEYNAVDNAKRAIKKIVNNQNSSNNPGEFRYSKYLIIQSLTDRKVSENSHSTYMFSEEEVNKAFAALRSEIDFSKFFKDQAIKSLQNIEHVYTISSKVNYEKYLAAKRFTKEEIDNAFNTVKIDFAYNAQRQAERLLKDYMSESSKLRIIKWLQNEDHFTKEEAEAGVNRLNYDFKINIRNWINIRSLGDDNTQAWAKLYSKNSIIRHLTDSNEFVESEVREVLAEYNINYTERARLRAIDILKNEKYSRSNLIKTLINYYKFTEEEATNAVKDLKHENLTD